MDTGNMGGQGYHETAINRSSTSFLDPPPIHRSRHNVNHPPPPAPMQGVRSHNMSFQQRVAASSYRLPTNNTSRRTVNPSQDVVERGFVPPTGLGIFQPGHGGAVPDATGPRNLPYLRVLPTDEVAILETVNPSQDFVDTGPRHQRPVPPAGLRIYQPRHGGAVPEATRPRNLPYLRVLPTDEVAILGTVNPSQDVAETGLRHWGPVPPSSHRIYQPHHGGAVPEATRHRYLPHLRVLPTEEVAMLEVQGFYEVGNSIGHHRDMRLDIEDMLYGELLALGERIGNVNTGLSEETIRSHLKTRTFLSSATCINLEEAACADQETDSCIICQCDFENQEKIGSLNCGHEYHADCLKKWLLVKNVCPLCRSSALTTERRGV